ncbi:hypothetical protein DIPPA_11658 [Diplonema papillatum]|nr:hypothetical protein DIPPA_11658 [Diplonema papillatum]
MSAASAVWAGFDAVLPQPPAEKPKTLARKHRQKPVAAYPFLTKRLQGCYGRLIAKELHPLIERWYYIETKLASRRVFKDILRNLWDTHKALTDGGDADGNPPSQQHKMVARTYTRDILNPEYHSAAAWYVAASGDAQLEAFKELFGVLHVVSQRRPKTQYTRNYQSYSKDELAMVKVTSNHREAIEQDVAGVWSRFQERSLQKNAADAVDGGNRTAQRSAVDGLVKSLKQKVDAGLIVNFKKEPRNCVAAARDFHTARPPYARWFDGDDPFARGEPERSQNAVYARNCAAARACREEAAANRPAARPFSARIPYSASPPPSMPFTPRPPAMPMRG